VTRTTTMGPKTTRPTRLALSIAAVLASSSGIAAQIETGSADASVRWDNTIKYSAGYRLKDADPTLASDVNQGDGDTNFRRRGLISNRVDLLSELEASYQGFGLRLSGAAWHDTLYRRSNQNDTAGAFGPGTSAVNSTEISAPNQFSSYARKVHGSDAEMLDAFVSAKVDLGGHAATVRLGQHTVLWGESLFFGDNAIAGAMSPVDVAKALSVPNLRFQEILRPVPQVSGQIQVNDAVSVYAFYQLKWKESRSQSSGSYFSPFDFQTGGNLILTPAGPLVRSATHDAKDSGQGGLSLRIRGDDMDYGLYAVRFNSKNAAYVVSPMTGTYYENYHNGITAFGASVNRSVGAFNLAAEASVRNNQDLLSPNAYDVGGGAQYGVGRTAHLNLSAFGTNLGRTALWNDANLLAELAYSKVTRITKGADAMSGCQPAFFPGSVCAPNGTRSNWRMQVLFEPIYYQAFPGVDLRVPMGISYVPKGSRNMVGPAPMPEDAGSINLGLASTYLDVWRVALNYSHYFGKSGVLFSPISAGGTQAWNYKQYFADRDNVSFVFSRTF